MRNPKLYRFKKAQRIPTLWSLKRPLIPTWSRLHRSNYHIEPKDSVDNTYLHICDPWISYCPQTHSIHLPQIIHYIDKQRSTTTHPHPPNEISTYLKCLYVQCTRFQQRKRTPNSNAKKSKNQRWPLCIKADADQLLYMGWILSCCEAVWPSKSILRRVR